MTTVYALAFLVLVAAPLVAREVQLRRRVPLRVPLDLDGSLRREVERGY